MSWTGTAMTAHLGKKDSFRVIRQIAPCTIPHHYLDWYTPRRRKEARVARTTSIIISCIIYCTSSMSGLGPLAMIRLAMWSAWASVCLKSVKRISRYCGPH